ncbi:MAG: glycine cleavage system aminomethyltransferase GcvT [Bacteroidales bacterium]|nr:glycine cleavage system aminomethyltransferase GcvT [Bacteroidales bacterium]
MKNTAFIDFHKSLGAKIVSFAGYNMPIQFEGINVEHETVRKKVGVFDVSHMGEFWVKGQKAFELVQKLTSNDVAKLTEGKIQYTCFPNEIGGIVDDLLVYCIDNETYLLVVNASNIEKDWEWVNSKNDIGAELYNVSDETSQLAVQGPNALELMQKLTDTDLSSISYYTFKYAEIAGVKNVLISATGYTGAGGFEIYMENKDAKKIWEAVFEAGREFGVKPIGLAARDTLRLEMGFCLYGNDIDDKTSPIEAGLGWITKFVDGNNFTNREAIQKQKEDGVSKRLKAFEMIDKGIPRQHYEICDSEGNTIGEVTSGTMSPSMKKAIGMGYVKSGFTKLDTEIFIKIRDKLRKAKIVKLPFYKG